MIKPNTVSEFLSREDTVQQRKEILALVVRDMLYRGKTVDDVVKWVTEYIEEMIKVGLKLQDMASRIDWIEQGKSADLSDGTVHADTGITIRLADRLREMYRWGDVDDGRVWHELANECIRQMEWAQNCALSVGEQRLAVHLGTDTEEAKKNIALDCPLSLAPEGWQP